jgi:hypothetical protein
MNDFAGTDIAPGGTSRLSATSRGCYPEVSMSLMGSCGATPSLSHVEEALQAVTHASTVRA